MAKLKHGKLAIETESILKNIIFEASLQKLTTEKDGRIELIFDHGLTLDLITRLGVLFNTKRVDIEPKAESGTCSCCCATETYIILSFNDGQLSEERLKEFVLTELQRTVEIYVEEGRTKCWTIPSYLEEYIADIKKLFPEYEMKELKSSNKRAESFFVLSWEQYEKTKEAIETMNAGGRA